MLARGGVALAFGPVGIGLFAASVAAPYVIGAIWKKGNQIYQANKNEVEKSNLTPTDMATIVKAKQSKKGDVIPLLQNLLIKSDKGKVLFNADGNGQVLTNNFNPKHELAFYTESESGERNMLLDEVQLSPEALKNPQDNSLKIFNNPQTDPTTAQASQVNPTEPQAKKQIDTTVVGVKPEDILKTPPADILPSSEPEVTIPEEPQKGAIAPESVKVSSLTPSAEKVVSGSNVALSSLKTLASNNAQNPALANKVTFLKSGLSEAKANSKIQLYSNIKEAIGLNKAGSSIIKLFNLQQDRSKTLETQEYAISRRGRDYFLQDKEGKTLLHARSTPFGTQIKSSQLNPTQMQDLKYLSSVKVGKVK